MALKCERAEEEAQNQKSHGSMSGEKRQHFIHCLKLCDRMTQIGGFSYLITNERNAFTHSERETRPTARTGRPRPDLRCPWKPGQALPTRRRPDTLAFRVGPSAPAQPSGMWHRVVANKTLTQNNPNSNRNLLGAFLTDKNWVSPNVWVGAGAVGALQRNSRGGPRCPPRLSARPGPRGWAAHRVAVICTRSLTRTPALPETPGHSVAAAAGATLSPVPWHRGQHRGSAGSDGPSPSSAPRGSPSRPKTPVSAGSRCSARPSSPKCPVTPPPALLPPPQAATPRAPRLRGHHSRV